MPSPPLASVVPPASLPFATELMFSCAPIEHPAITRLRRHRQHLLDTSDLIREMPLPRPSPLTPPCKRTYHVVTLSNSVLVDKTVQLTPRIGTSPISSSLAIYDQSSSTVVWKLENLHKERL